MPAIPSIRPQLAIQAPPELLEALKLVALNWDEAMTDLVRQALGDWLKRQV